jgi:hypothetical protein
MNSHLWVAGPSPSCFRLCGQRRPANAGRFQPGRDTLLERPRRPARTSALAVAVAVLAVALGQEGPAQTTPVSPGPYTNYNWNANYGLPYYNQGYAQYGFPGVGVSPWDPIVNAQLNLGLRTARYNMYSAWADQSNAIANYYYQQAMAQALQNAQQQQSLQSHYDVRNRAPRPAPPSEAQPASLPRNSVLKNDGTVLWPTSAPSSEMLDKIRSAAEAAIRVAVKEFETEGRASIQSIAEAKSELFAYGKPALEQLVHANRDDANKLLHFLASLERVLNELAAE